MKFAEDGMPSTLVFLVPEGVSSDGSELGCFAIPVRARAGGLLLCVPRGAISEEVLIQALSGDDPTSMVGPSKLVEVALCEESEDGQVVSLDVSTHAYVVDFSDDILPFLMEYDGTPEFENVPISFSEAFPAALPETNSLLQATNVWLAQLPAERVNFYSAREEQEAPTVSPKANAKLAGAKRPSAVSKRITNAQVMESVAALTEQVKLLAARQQQLEVGVKPSSASHVPVPPDGERRLPFAGLPTVASSLHPPQHGSLEGVPKVATLLGPPPKTRAAAESGLASQALPEEPLNLLDPAGQGQIDSGLALVLHQQSKALTSLVAHIASQSDPFSDVHLTGASSSSSTSTKGSQRRERMQSDLANGTSSYYLTLMQQVHRRMFPGKPVPRSESELAATSFLAYLEKTGGYRNAREAGLLMWLLGHVADAAAADNMWLVRERLALVLVSLEQSVTDQGDWTLAYLLSLAEDPPLTLFQDRTATVSPYGTPFAPLVAPAWSATLLSYIKELEILSSKKLETASSPRKPKAQQPAADSADKQDPSPKRKPRFPKRPKEAPAQPK